MRELINQACNHTLNSSDRGKIEVKICHFYEELIEISLNIEFNEQNLFTDRGYNPVVIGIQTGANAKQRLDIRIDSMFLAFLKLNTLGEDFSLVSGAELFERLTAKPRC